MRHYIDYNTFESHVKNLGMTVLKLDVAYNHGDCRCWSALINPSTDNIIVTFVVNREKYGSYYFDMLTQDRTATNIFVADIYDILSDITGQTQVNIDLEDQE
jgi:hypothetical protein